MGKTFDGDIEGIYQGLRVYGIQKLCGISDDDILEEVFKNFKSSDNEKIRSDGMKKFMDDKWNAHYEILSERMNERIKELSHVLPTLLENIPLASMPKVVSPVYIKFPDESGDYWRLSEGDDNVIVEHFDGKSLKFK